MDLQQFLDTCTGDWFSQRTCYNLPEEKCDNNKANITVEKLRADDPEIVNLCAEVGLSTNENSSGTKISWENSVDWGKPKENGSSLVVFIPDENNSSTGKIIRKINKIGAKISAGNYILGPDEALTLTIDNGNQIIEERQWFASPNLRLRCSICKIDNHHTMTTFYSEIKRVVTNK